jgi:hypothetical protein
MSGNCRKNGAKKNSQQWSHQTPWKLWLFYILISSILDRICEMIKTPLGYPRDPTLLDPFTHLLQIRTWGT